MTTRRTSATLKVALALAALPPSGTALAQTYYKWQTVEMPSASGARCGNGSPYRIFVNRTPLTSKTVVMFEGGGACWAKGSCSGEGGLLGGELVRALEGYLPPLDAFDRFPGSSALAMQRLG